MKLEHYLQSHYRKSTAKSILNHIKRFRDYYPDIAESATYWDVLNYLKHLRKNCDLHPKTLRHCLYGVKVYFNYLIETAQRSDHPCSELYLKDKINKQIAVDKLYSETSLENFLEGYQIKQKAQLETRNKIIISLLIYQGLTVGEITALQTQHLDLEKGTVSIEGGSQQRGRTLFLQAKQVLLFKHYIEKERNNLLKHNEQNLGESSFILSQYGTRLNPHSISKIINENPVQSQQLQPIKIRQSVITNLLKKGNDVRVVQVFAGHKSVSTTLQYRQTALEELQTAVEHYHPI